MASAAVDPPGCVPWALHEWSTASSGGLTDRLTAATADNPLVVMRPLRGGVNAAVPSITFALLRGLLGRPVHLRLHERSAGGTYMVRLPGADGGQIRAVFKPRAEEIGQERNPHGNCTSERAGEFVPGTGSRREVLAYLLDHEGSAGVVPTIEACAAPAASADGDGDGSEWGDDEAHVGSLLLFVPGCVEAADVLPGEFAVEEVHRIAIFDIRTLNSDRHGGNVLVFYACGATRAAPHLVPIDHSYICPAGFADPEFEWLSWPQAKVPFSPAARGYIARLDEGHDAAILRAALGRRSHRGESYDREAMGDDASAAEEVLRCTTRILRVAALEYGMTAHDIGQLCRRRTLATPSALEELMEESRDEAWHVQYARFEEMLHARLKREGRTRNERWKEGSARDTAKTEGNELHGVC